MKSFAKQSLRIGMPVFASGVLSWLLLVAATAADLPKPEEILRLYVPTSELHAALSGDHPGALLPAAEFEKLLQDAQAASAANVSLPEAAAISTADYQGRIDGDRLRMTCRIVIRTFQPGWRTATIHVGGLGVASATSGEGEDIVQAPIARSTENADDLIVFLPDAGTHNITLELTTPLTAVGSDQAAAFQLAGAAAGNFTVTAPPLKRLSLGGLDVARPAPIDQPADYVIPVGSLKQLQLTITERRENDRADAVTFATSAIGILAAPGEATWNAKTRLSVFGHPIDTLECEIPSHLEITTVESPGLASWTLEDAGNSRTRITLTWRQPFDGVRPVQLQGVFSASEGRWVAPDLIVKDVASHTGVLILRRPPGVRLQILQSSGLRQTSADEARLRTELTEDPGDLATSLMFQIWEENFTLEFIPAEKDREVQAAMTTLLGLNAQGADLLTTMTVETRFAPLFNLDIDLPAVWLMNGVTVNGAAVDWQLVPHEAGRNRIRVELNPPLAPGENRTVTLNAHYEPEGWPVEDEAVRIPLPEVRLPQASAVEALFGVTADDDLDLAPIDVTGLDPAHLSDMENLNRQLAPLGKSARLGFTFQDTVFQGQLEVSRMAPRLSAVCIVLTRVEPEAVLSHVEAQLTIAGGGLRDLVLTLPEAVGRNVRFRLTPYQPVPVFGAVPDPAALQTAVVAVDVPNIIEQQPGDAANGVIPWTIKLDRYARGMFVLQAELSQPRTAPAAGAIERLLVPALSVPGAEPESGAIGIEASDEQHMTVYSQSAAGTPLAPLDPIDFPPAHARPRERLVTTLQYERPGWSVGIVEERLSRTALPMAIVHSLNIQSLMDNSGIRQTQADADLAAVGVQSIRVELPEGNTLWTASVDGAPVEVRRAGDAITIPLSPVDPPDRHRAVRLIYAPEDSRGASSSPAEITIRDRPPAFAVVTGRGDPQPLEILETTWTVHHPEHFDLIRSEGEFHPDHEVERNSFLRRLFSMFRLPGASRGITRGIWLLGVFVFVALISLSRGWSAATVAKVLVVAVIGCFLVAVLMMPTVQQARHPAGTTEVAAETLPYPSYVPYDTQDAPAAAAPSSEMDWDRQQNPPAGEPASVRSDPSQQGIPMFANPQTPFEAKDSTPEADGMVMDETKKLKQQFEYRGRSQADELAKEAAPSDSSQPASESRPSSQFRQRLGDQIEESLKSQDRASGESSEGVLMESLARATKPAAAKAARISAGAGLLSVAFILQPPEGSVSEEFRAISAGGGSNDSLNIQFINQDARSSSMILIAVAVALLGWWRRESSRRSKLLFLIVTLIAPIAFRNLAPIAWLNVLDGLWLGGLLTIVLWLIHATVRCVQRSCKCRKSSTPVSSPVVASGVMLLVAFMATSASAQDKPAPPPSPPTVFIPYDDTADPLSARNVFVPQDLFLKLWTAAHPEQTPSTPAPLDGVVSAASFVLDATQITTPAGAKSGATALVHGRLLLHNFRDTPITLTLPLKCPLRSATLDGEPAVVEIAPPARRPAKRGKSKGRKPAVVEVDPASQALRVHVPNKGLSVLDIEFDQPVEINGPAGRVSWINDPFSAGRLTVWLPAEGLDVRINGTRTTSLGTEQVDEKTVPTVEIPIDRGGTQTVAWQPPTDGGNENAVQLQTVVVAAIEDAGLSLKSTYALRVRQGSMTEIAFQLPAALRLKKIDGADIGGWRVEGEGDSRVLTVSFLRKIEGPTDFSIETFQPLEIVDAPVTLTITPLAPQNIARESGRIGLFTESHLAVRPTDSQGLTREEATQFAVPMDSGKPSATATLQYAYRFSQRPASLDVLIERRQPETKATLQHGALIARHKQHASTRIMFHIAGAPRSTLSIALPAEYLLVEAVCGPMVDYFTTEEAGAKILTIELGQPTTGDVEVVLDGVIPRADADPSVAVTIPSPQQVAQLDSSLAIWVDDTYLATTDAPADWTATDPATIGEPLQSLRPQPIRFAFKSTKMTPAAVTVGLSEQAAELAADALTLIAVTDASIDYGLTLQWRITQAATDTLTFTTPSWMRGRLDFAGAGIRQIKSAIAPNDRVRWTVLLTDPVRDRFLLTAAASLSTPPDGRITAPDIQFENAAGANGFVNLEVQQQFAVVVNLSRKSLAIEDASAVETLSRDRLPLRLPDPLVQQAMAITRILPGRTATWLARETGAVAAVQATVTGARLETVLDWDGNWRTKATWTVRNRGRQYLPVDVPSEGATRLLSVLVKGRPARTVSTTIGEKTIELVPLPPSSSADLSFDVVLHFAGRLEKELPREAAVTATTLSLPAPRIVSPAESAEYGVPVAQTAWVVTLPEGVEGDLDDDSNLTSHQTGDWALMAESQYLTQLESEFAEMSRIVSDERASFTRRSQARDNLRQLGVALQNVPAAVSATPLAGKTAEIREENSSRKVLLGKKLDETLSRGLNVQTAPNEGENYLNVPFRQGNFSKAPSAGQSSDGVGYSIQSNGVGNAYILNNSGQILNLNNAGNVNGIVDYESSENFGFKETIQDGRDEKAGAAVSHGRRYLNSQIQKQEAGQAQNFFSDGAVASFGLQANDKRNFAVPPDSFQAGGMPGPTGAFGGGMGGGAMGMGGMAGGTNGTMGGFEPGLSLIITQNQAALADVDMAGWTEIGGLSLPIELPELSGNALAFSKSGGDPKLVLKTRSTRTQTVAWSLAEAVLWFVAAAALLFAVGNAGRFSRLAAALVAVLAGVAFLLLPGDERWLALLIFSAALLTALLLSPRRKPVEAAQGA